MKGGFAANGERGRWRMEGDFCVFLPSLLPVVIRES